MDAPEDDRIATIPSEEDTKCDFTFCAPQCCQKLRTRRLVLFWISWCAFVQTMTSDGLVSGVLTTLERRYQLSSTESGAIAALYDVGAILVVVPASFMGGKWRRCRVLAWGLLLAAFSSILMALPQLTSGHYQYEAPIPPICYRNANISYDELCNENQKNLNNYKYLFWVGNFLFGIGSSLVYFLGIAYIDENVNKTTSPVYFAIFYLLGLMGPAVGFVGASVILDIYVDPGRAHPGLSPDDQETWVGAWWIGFFVSAFLAAVAIIPLYGFPKELPGTAEIREKKIIQSYGNSESKTMNLTMAWREFPRVVKVLICNPTFMFITAATCVEDILVQGFTVFGPKYFEVIFKVDPSTASLLFGAVLVPSGGVAVIIGGIVIRHFKMTLRGILKLQAFVAMAAIPFAFMFLIPCGNSEEIGKVAGLNSPYVGDGTLNTINFTSACNADCQCLTDAFLFKPLCGSNGLTYYSPCYAGCVSKSEMMYSNCTCIATNSSTIQSETSGSCNQDCKNYPLFMALFALVVVIIFFTASAVVESSLLCIPEKQRTFSLGIQSMLFRALGNIPGPLIFGAIIDSSCIWWNRKCSVRENCAFYRERDIQNGFTIIGVIGFTLTSLGFLLAWLFYKSDDTTTGDLNNKESNIQEERL